MDEILLTLEHLTRLHKAATQEPWWLGWIDETDPETDPPSAVCFADPDGMAPLLEIAHEHLGYPEAPADLRVTEAARNALPLFIALARAAHRHLSGPDAESAAALRGALERLTDVLPRKNDGTPVISD